MQRYLQQTILPEYGDQGQKKIADSRVLVVGAGGLGSIVAGYLAAVGVGNLGICDFDVVAQTNLHRQFLYAPGDMGKLKTNVLSQRLCQQNPNVHVTAIAERISKTNAQDIIFGHHVVCDCSDNLETRQLLDEICGTAIIPLVHGAVSDWQGYLTVFHAKNDFGLSDLFETETLLSAQNCALNGIHSPICGIIGSYMTSEVIKLILGLETVLDGTIFYMDGLNNRTHHLRLKKHTSKKHV